MCHLNLTTALCLLTLGLVSLGCDEDDFDSVSELKGYRVLGVELSAPEVGPDDAVTVTVHDFDSEERERTYAWKLCLYSFGSKVDYACVDERLSLPLDSNSATATVDLGPQGANLRALYEQVGPLPGGDGEPRTLADGFDVWIELTSGPADDPIRSIKRLRVREAEVAPNQNPVIKGFTVDGALKAGGEVNLTLDVTAPEAYVNAEGETVDEVLLYAYFSDAGELRQPRAYDDDLTNILTLPDTAGPISVFVTVRDDRGGFAIAERTLIVEP